MLELLRNDRAPAALLMAEADAILALGVVIAKELGYPGIPVVEVGPARISGFDEEEDVHVEGPEIRSTRSP